MDGEAKPRERRERRPSAISLSSSDVNQAQGGGDAGNPEQGGQLYNADQAMEELVEKLYAGLCSASSSAFNLTLAITRAG